LIEEQLRRIIRQPDWALMDIRINYFEPFKEVYGFVAGDDVLRFTAMLISEVANELGTINDFIGHAGGDNFILITSQAAAPAIRHKLSARFAEEIQAHYSFLDRQQGAITTSAAGQPEMHAPLMTLATGVVSPADYQFTDIREITELAAEARRRSVPGTWN
jgi:GGDEF domain-containing protein